METKMIHPTAIVSPDANIEEGVSIGAYSIIGEDVTIGQGTWIGPHVVVDPHVTIGPGCRIFQFAAIGAIPQDLKFGGEKSYVKIGQGVTIREFVTIHRGTESGGGITEVGENLY
jgi:UDP-N-acetylglucosamine acyltransferase